MRILIAIGLLSISAGCASVKPSAGAGRPFDFEGDTFAYANELVFNSQNGAHTADTNSPGYEH